MIILYYIRFFFYRGRFAHWWRPLSRGDNQVNFGGNPPLRTPFRLGGWIRSAAEHTAPQLFFFLMSFSLSLQTLISIKKKERSRKKGSIVVAADPADDEEICPSSDRFHASFRFKGLYITCPFCTWLRKPQQVPLSWVTLLQKMWENTKQK